MKALQEFLTQTDHGERLNEIKQALLADQRLRQYLKAKQIELTDALIDQSLSNLLTFNDNFFKCEHCESIETCGQDYPGYRPELELVGDRLHLVYKPCPFQVELEQKHKLKNLIKSFYMPKSILNATIESLDYKDNQYRINAINQVLSFASSYDGKSFQRGVYLYGTFGVGKTYILAVMANQLAKRNIQVGFVYLPDLVRELKSAIGSHNLETMMSEIKAIQVLVLDDIGAEMNSAWVRDEILGPLLQHRLLEGLPTFFTSNRSIEELIDDYSRTTDGHIDKVKASRLGDRIKALAKEIKLEGKNYRY